MSVYTKTGDKGKTSLFDPSPLSRIRVSKTDTRIRAIGAVDELNSYLGVANAYCETNEIVSFVKETQKDLFQIGGILSKAPLHLSKERVTLLEKKIDEIEEQLPPLRNFIIPEGSLSAVHFMYARSVCRKAERIIVSLSKKETIEPTILEYINRLSDLLFVVFRAENAKTKQKEELWKGEK